MTPTGNAFYSLYITIIVCLKTFQYLKRYNNPEGIKRFCFYIIFVLKVRIFSQKFEILSFWEKVGFILCWYEDSTGSGEEILNKQTALSATWLSENTLCFLFLIFSWHTQQCKASKTVACWHKLKLRLSYPSNPFIGLRCSDFYLTLNQFLGIGN